MDRDPDAYNSKRDIFQPDDAQAAYAGMSEDVVHGTGAKVMVWLAAALIILASFYIYRFGFAQDSFVHWYQKKNGDWVAAADATTYLRVIEPVRLTGSILAKKAYRDDLARISPVDFVLGWEEYLDPAKAQPLSIWQDERTYYWTSPRVGAMRQIVTSTANLHLIAADDLVAASLQKLESGQFVKIDGQLVDVYRNGEKIWRSSRAPDDIGYNSGEIIFVEGVQTIR